MSHYSSLKNRLPVSSPKCTLASPGARVPWYNCLKTAPLEIQNSLEDLKSSAIKELVLLVQQSMFQVSLTTELFGILIPISTAFRKYLRRLWIEHTGPFNRKKRTSLFSLTPNQQFILNAGSTHQSEQYLCSSPREINHILILLYNCCKQCAWTQLLLNYLRH